MGIEAHQRESKEQRIEAHSVPAGRQALALATTVPSSALAGSPLLLGPASNARPTYQGYYDGHKDTYLITDVWDKSQASALHINYSAALATFKGAPAQYFVQGRAASRPDRGIRVRARQAGLQPALG